MDFVSLFLAILLPQKNTCHNIEKNISLSSIDKYYIFQAFLPANKRLDLGEACLCCFKNKCQIRLEINKQETVYAPIPIYQNGLSIPNKGPLRHMFTQSKGIFTARFACCRTCYDKNIKNGEHLFVLTTEKDINEQKFTKEKLVCAEKENEDLRVQVKKLRQETEFYKERVVALSELAPVFCKDIQGEIAKYIDPACFLLLNIRDGNQNYFPVDKKTKALLACEVTDINFMTKLKDYIRKELDGKTVHTGYLERGLVYLSVERMSECPNLMGFIPVTRDNQKIEEMAKKIVYTFHKFLKPIIIKSATRENDEKMLLELIDDLKVIAK